VGIRAEAIDSTDKMNIIVSGCFDFSMQEDFELAYQQGEPDRTEYTLDLSTVDYMDSSALGMLLQLKDYAGSAGGDIKIKTCNRQIINILRISNFNLMFQIIDA
jgi:HptB-dependent secretion and biofilm anti anti-sigma factor